MKFEFRPRIVVNADTVEAARNVILKILASAELSGRIFTFEVPFDPEARNDD